MPIICKKTAGYLMIFGLSLILALNLIFSQSILVSLALVAFLFLTIFFLFDPKWGFLLFLLIRPSIDKFSDDFKIKLLENFSVNISAILGAIFFFLVVVYLMKNKVNIFKPVLSVFWVSFIAFSVLSILFSVDKNASIYEIIRLSTIFASFILAYQIIIEQKNKKILLQIILASAFLPLMEGLYQFFTHTGLGGTSGIESRLSGTFSHPNSFASFVLVILALSLYLFLYAKSHYRLFYFSFFLLSLFIIFGTYSRGAWLALAIFAFILGIIKNRKIIFIALGVFLITFAFSENFRYRLQDVYNPSSTGSVVWRLEQWDKIFNVYIKKPLTGYGSGTEIIVHQNEFGLSAGNPYTHNDFLKSALETGILGVLSYAGLILSTLILLFNRYRKTTDVETKNLILIILALFAGEVVFSMTSNIFRGTATQWILWSLIGISLISKKNEK